MKKLLVIALLALYGFSATGMTINLHYCCGKLKSIGWSVATDDGCGRSHKMGNKPCCENKQISSKPFGDAEKALLLLKQVKPIADGLRPATHVMVEKPVNRQVSPVAFAPPPLPCLPLFVLHCVYQI